MQRVHPSARPPTVITAQLLEDATTSPEAAAARLKAPRTPALRSAGASVILLGQIPSAVVGATLVVRGMWDNHAKHGWQIRCVVGAAVG